MNPHIEQTIALLQSKIDGLQIIILTLKELDAGEELAGRTFYKTPAQAEDGSLKAAGARQARKTRKIRSNSRAASPSPTVTGNGVRGGHAERQERYVAAIGKLGEEFSTKDFGSLFPDVVNPTGVLTGLAKKNLIRKFGRGIWTTRQAIGEKIHRAMARKPKREDLPSPALADYEQRKRELGLAVGEKTDDE